MSDQNLLIPDKEYFTTGEISAHCAVTADAVRKWLQSGILRAEVTAGGHYRIHRNALLAFLKKRHARNLGSREMKQFQYCWEFHARSEGIYESCQHCIVYRSRAARCYELAKLTPKAGHSLLFCTNTCEECAYYEIVHGKQPNFLVVTSRREVQAAFAIQARDHDYSIRFTDRGYQCSLLIESYRPDIVIIDWCEGGSFDSDFIKDISEDPRIPLAQIIIIGDPADFPESHRRMVSGFLLTPISKIKLKEIIGGL